MTTQTKRMRTASGVVAVLLAATLAGCGQTTAKTPSAVAVINGKPLTLADFHTAVAAIGLLTGQKLPTTYQANQQLVQGLASQWAVEQWALAHHWISVAQARKQATQFLNQNLVPQVGGSKAFQQTLKTFHLTQNSLTAFLTQDMELRAAYDRETHSIQSLPKGTASQFYASHHADFETPRQVLVRHILVKSKALAETLLKELKHGAHFSALAKKYSQDPGTKNNGGSLGWVDVGPQSGFVPAFYHVMDHLKPGQYGIAHSQYGYHVIEVQAQRLPKLEPYSQVRSEIVQYLLQSKQQQAFSAFSKKVTHASHITYDYTLLKSPAHS
jgi:parvulin-like peptidyl-prolyl isomerase